MDTDMNEPSLESKVAPLLADSKDSESSVPLQKQAESTGEETQPEGSVHASLFEGDPNKNWYVLRARSGYERKAHDAILARLKNKKMEHLVEDVFIPGEDVTRIKAGKKRKTHLLYFNGYVLIKMKLTNELWHLLMDVPNISGFVGGTSEQPRSLSKKELTDISSLMNEGIRQEVMKEEYEVGQHVMIIEGPFANFAGEIASVETEKSKLRVMINILGRATPVELDFTKVRHHVEEKQ